MIKVSETFPINISNKRAYFNKHLYKFTNYKSKTYLVTPSSFLSLVDLNTGRFDFKKDAKVSSFRELSCLRRASPGVVADFSEGFFATTFS